MDDIVELFKLIRERCDLNEIVDLCDIEVGELTLRLRSNIIKHRGKFESFLDVYEKDEEEEYDDTI